MTIQEEKLAYIAGLLDSSKGEITDEGDIHFYHENNLLIKVLQDNFGGKTLKYPDGISWFKYADEDTVSILKQLLPFLIRNRLSAEIAIRDLS